VSVTPNPTNSFPELPPVSTPEEVRDICRESELTPGEAHAAYLELNGQITVHLDSIVGKMVDATKEFKTHLLPLLDMMQSMLSKRGKLRKLLNSAAVPTWEEWFDDFEKRLHLDISFRTVQRWLKDYREAEGGEPPAPNVNALAKRSVRQIESKRQAETLESVVKERKKLDPANRSNLIRAIEATIEEWEALLAKLKKDFVPPVSEILQGFPHGRKPGRRRKPRTTQSNKLAVSPMAVAVSHQLEREGVELALKALDHCVMKGRADDAGEDAYQNLASWLKLKQSNKALCDRARYLVREYEKLRSTHS
jgi:hypothetical protein